MMAGAPIVTMETPAGVKDQSKPKSPVPGPENPKTKSPILDNENPKPEPPVRRGTEGSKKLPNPSKSDIAVRNKIKLANTQNVVFLNPQAPYQRERRMSVVQGRRMSIVSPGYNNALGAQPEDGGSLVPKLPFSRDSRRGSVVA